MNIYQALIQDHNEVKKYLTELVELNEDNVERRGELISLIRDALIPHARAEEAVFYNSLRLLKSTNDLGWEGYKEHMEAETLLRSLQVMDKLDVTWRATALKLKKSLEHHIMEEEQQMIPVAQQLFTQQEAIAMAEAFNAMKPEVKEEGLMKNTLDMVVNMMPPRFTDQFRKFDMNHRH